MGAGSSGRRERFRLYLIKPSHYDDDGYVIQWVRSEVPSNSLAVLFGLALDCRARRILGDAVDIEIRTIDEIHHRVRPRRIISDIRGNGGKGLVAIVGVQSNQYPRALDIARPLRSAAIPVCIGGFHVSGTLAMIPGISPDIQEAWDFGVSLFAGEAEGRLEEVLRDAYHGTLKPLYNHLAEPPGLVNAPLPVASRASLERNISSKATVDCGRGCPFQCSFCTIINVQGRTVRWRAPEDVECSVRQHWARGVRALFITDDNFARNRQWEAVFDRLIKLREVEGLNLRIMLQVDTLAHRIPGFIDKARRAGVGYVFIGLENINLDNLMAARKKQNRIGEYRLMLQKWKEIGAVTVCGYIIGFPNDTPERVLNDIETLKRELPVDVAEFFCLTPLPGSEDHKRLYEKGAWLDPDLNIYDTEHVCCEHPRMSKDEWIETYRRAWDSFYTPEHVETLLRRATATGSNIGKITGSLLFAYANRSIEGVHPLQSGLFRRKYRRDRRPSLPVESPWVFYPRYAWEITAKTSRLLALSWQFYRIYRRVHHDAGKLSRRDLALTAVSEAKTSPLASTAAGQAGR